MKEKLTSAQLAKAFPEYFSEPLISEPEILDLMDKMCIESLSPDVFEKWEAVKDQLKANRKLLKK